MRSTAMRAVLFVAATAFGAAQAAAQQVATPPFEAGKHYAVFHGVAKAVHPDADYSGKLPQNLAAFHRNVYVVPIEFSAGPGGVPKIRLVDDPREG